MAAWFGQQALTVVLPVRSGQEGALERFLELGSATVREKLREVGSLHAGRFVLIPPGGRGATAGGDASKPVLLFESNFDGPSAAHFAELGRALEAELSGMLGHCEEAGGANGLGLEARLRAGVRRAGAFFSAHPGLSVQRVQADARLRAAFSRSVRAGRAQFALESPLAIVERVRAKLGVRFDFASSSPATSETPAGFASASADRRAAISAVPPLWRAAGLLPLLARAAVRDAIDAVHELWTDASLDRSGLAARLERIAASEGGCSQRTLTHVAELKPGRFRRRALRAALRFADGWLRARRRSSLLGSSHFARFVELGDGRLVFLSHHDASFEAEMGAFIERSSFLLSLIWSNTCDFPAGFGALLGGTRDEPRFKAWALVKRIPTAIAYSAYPELTLSDVRRGAELRALLGGKLDGESARRALDFA